MSQPGRHGAELPYMPVQRIRRRQENGIIAPDDTVPAQVTGQFLERADYLLFRRQERFGISAIGRNGELEITRQSLQFLYIRHHRHRVLGPEDEAVYITGQKGNAADLLRVERIGDEDEAFTETPEEPRTVKRRYIGPAAGTDNHIRILPFFSLTTCQFNQSMLSQETNSSRELK